MTFKQLAEHLLSAGYPVLPAEGKAVYIDNWQSMSITPEVVRYWASNGQANNNIGIRTGDASISGLPLTLADIDIYDKEVARVVAASVETTFGATLERRGQAPKRGLVYVQDKPFKKLQRTIKDSDGVKHKVEWLGKGQQFVGFGIHPDTKKPYGWRDERSLNDVDPWELPVVTEAAVNNWLDNVLPGLLPDDWSIEGVTSSGDDQSGLSAEERALVNFKPKLDITTDYLRQMVMFIDPNLSYAEWVNVAMGIHHQSGGEQWGFDLFDEWSALGADYKPREVESKWRSMKNDASKGAIVTAATIIKMAKETEAYAAFEREQKVASLNKWVLKIEAAQDEYKLQEVVEKGIAQDRELSTVEIAKLEALVKEAFAKFGVNLTKQTVTKMMKRKTSAGGSSGAPMEAWCDGYVWCQFEDAFIKVDVQEAVSVQSFNARHGRDVKNRWMTPDGFQMQASHVALQEIQIPVVARRMYLPWAEQMFSRDGVDYLNRYRPSTVPASKSSVDWSDESKKAIDLVNTHIEKLCGSEAKVIKQWMAYCVQNPGKKIRWSVIIKGTYGDGKSTLGQILELAMGQSNVGKASPKVVNSDFNGWAEGFCVCLLEELRMQGHNRYDTANSLKELHTNDTVTIHRKGKDPYVVANTQNYMAFTNFADAVPIEDSDRRWFVVFTPFVCEQDIISAGMTAKYFDDLFDAIRGNVDALRGWLLEMDLTGFNANGRSPDSDAKKVMIAAGRHEEDEAIEELISSNAIGISSEVISTNHLSSHLLALDNPIDLRGRQISTVLSRMGYVRRPNTITWREKTHRVWLKDITKITDNRAIQKLLDNTVAAHNAKGNGNVEF